MANTNYIRKLPDRVEYNIDDITRSREAVEILMYALLIEYIANANSTKSEMGTLLYYFEIACLVIMMIATIANIYEIDANLKGNTKMTLKVQEAYGILLASTLSIIIVAVVVFFKDLMTQSIMILSTAQLVS